jgi:hypothetical protein
MSKINISDIKDIKAILFFDKIKEVFKLNNDFIIENDDFFDIISISSKKFRNCYIQYYINLSLYTIFISGDICGSYCFENNEDLIKVVDMIINTDCIKSYWKLTKFYIDKIKKKCNDFIILENGSDIYFIINDYYIKFNKKIVNNYTILYNIKIQNYVNIYSILEVE